MQIEEDGPLWRVRWRWYEPMYNFMVVWSLIWNGIMLAIAISMISKGEFRSLWYLGFHGPIGLFVAFLTLAGLVNATTLEIAPLGMTIRHGPLPWLGNRCLLAVRVEQIYCRLSKVRVNGSARYELHADLGDGKTVRLLGGFDGPDEPRFLEQQIEARLGIQPRQVPGEYRN
jgi:hypothetical protein